MSNTNTKLFIKISTKSHLTLHIALGGNTHDKSCQFN